VCKWGSGKILVGIADEHGKMISKMLSAVDRYRVEAMTSGLFSY
jgi:hypothetical protein